MYTSAADLPSACLVGVHSGASSGDDDFRRSFDALDELQRLGGPALGAIVLVVDAGDHIPPAAWRNRLARLRRGSRPHRFAFITESNLARGVLTAISWIQPPSAEQQVRAWTTVEEGIAWIARDRPDAPPILQRLYQEARRAAEPPGHSMRP